MDLRELREQRMMTQREVAERAHITVTTLSRIENGKVSASFRTIRSLAAVFSMSPQEMHEIVASAQLRLWPADTRLEKSGR
ncbi:helix-turn-helix domain-containing protein [Chloroflexota bacterium]